MRRRRLKRLIKRIKELQAQKLDRDELLLKLGAAKKEAGRAYALIAVELPPKEQAAQTGSFRFSLNRAKLRQVRRREGHYLLRSNLERESPAKLWEFYIQLTEVEQAFKELKSDLAVRPIWHQKDKRIEAHIFVAFLAYCLQVSMKARLKALAPGLTPRTLLEKLAGLQMVDIYLPTTDGRQLLLRRYTEPDADQRLLLAQLKLQLPKQPPPQIAVSSPPKHRSPTTLQCRPSVPVSMNFSYLAASTPANSGSRASPERNLRLSRGQSGRDPVSVRPVQFPILCT